MAKREWERVAIKVLDTNFYERGTTEFGPLITRIVAQNPDIADFSEMPPGDVGLIISGLQEQGWKGIKVWSTGTSHADLVRLAGDAANGTYMALAGDFADWSSTEIQRRLEAGSFAALGEHMNAVSLGAWDATMAIKTAMEEAQSVDPAKVREILPGINFQSSYGLTGFGGKEEYGSPQQMLLPILITQIKDGKIVERSRVIPPELFEILK